MDKDTQDLQNALDDIFGQIPLSDNSAQNPKNQKDSIESNIESNLDSIESEKSFESSKQPQINATPLDELLSNGLKDQNSKNSDSINLDSLKMPPQKAQIQSKENENLNSNFLQFSKEEQTLKTQEQEPQISQTPQQISKKSSKIMLLFLILSFGFAVFLITIFYHFITPRQLPTLSAKRVEYATRGNIYSQDGFLLASSRKSFRALINPKNIDPNKKELFVNLFSIYSQIPKERLLSRLQGEGTIILANDLDAKTASYLRQLNIKLNALDVFRSYTDSRGRVVKYGLGIVELGEQREYTYEDCLEPILGYVNKAERDGILRTLGIKGVEGAFERELLARRDGLLSNTRDIGFNVLLNGNATDISRQDGAGIVLSIPLKLQKKVERIADKAQAKLGAKEILIGVMETKSGKILSLASSARYNPNAINKDDYSKLNSSALEYSYEPGSIIKPIIYAIMLENKLFSPNEKIDLEGGKMKLGAFTISDTHALKAATPPEILLHSSNVGMAKLAQRIAPNDYSQELMRFGFGGASGFELPYEKTGILPEPVRFFSEVYRASVSYGYGIRTTFMQMLRAYNVINNNGILVSPYLAEFLVDLDGKKYKFKHDNGSRIISESSAKEVREILAQIVQNGTGRAAQIPSERGIVVGGKTGTAHIAQGGKYVRKYNSSFFGFAKKIENSSPIKVRAAVANSAKNEEIESKNIYTIGISVLEPNENDAYFAGQIAAPIFKEVVELLAEEGYF